MSRFEGEIAASGEARLSIVEMLALLQASGAAGEAERAQAIACYLAAGEGWKDAVKSLGGAFAADAQAAGSKDGKWISGALTTRFHNIFNGGPLNGSIETELHRS